MKISVVIPTFNSARTIRATIDSVLTQRHRPYEILVMDDGSTDETRSILSAYDGDVEVFHQENRGAAVARNNLCAKATGDLVAFLDSDDIWHPDYLVVQRRLAEKMPRAVAFFVGHRDFWGYGEYSWEAYDADPDSLQFEVMNSLGFFQKYNKGAAPFASLSYCCIPRSALNSLGHQPFVANGAEDTYLFLSLSVTGPIVYCPTPLVAYRVIDSSLSTNRVRVADALVLAFEQLNPLFSERADSQLYAAYKNAFSLKRRWYAKVLMGLGRKPEAREQLRKALRNTGLKSALKSAALLSSTYLPRSLQFRWPTSLRQVERSSQIS